MALKNIFSNKMLFGPYIAMSTVMISLFYLLLMLIEQTTAARGVVFQGLNFLLMVGVFICFLICFLVVLYVNAFLIKQRTQELGLYNIIGVEKKSLVLLVSLETFIVFLLSFALGIGVGLLLSKLIYLLMLQLIRISTPLIFNLNVGSIYITFFVFLCIFIAAILRTAFQMRKFKPIEILREKDKGEESPKFKLLSTLSGLACLGVGYYIAVTTESPFKALSQFFLAAFLVVIGTNLLFSSISIAVLKYLQSKRKIYYKSSNMLSISTMLFRMKKNARGLSSICILSTMLLISFSTTLALNINIDSLIRNRYRFDVEYFFDTHNLDSSSLTKQVLEIAEKHNVVANEFHTKKFYSTYGVTEDEVYNFDTKYTYGDEGGYFEFVPKSYFTELTGTELDIPTGEGYLLSRFPAETLRFISKGKEYSIPLQKVDDKDAKKFSSMDHSLIESRMVFLNDIDELASAFNEKNEKAYFQFNLVGEEKNKIAVLKELQIDAYREDAITSREELYALYGSLFFVGLYVSIIFLLASLLIIYYKQITEGIEDKERFKTLLRIGMEKKEVRKLIKKQIIYVFFLPLLFAVVHLSFAFPMLYRLLILLNFTQISLLLLSCAITVGLYFIVYVIMYKLTSRTYYKVVNQ